MPTIDFNGDGRSDVLWLLDETAAVSNWLATPSGGFVNNDARAFNWLTAWDYFELQLTGDFNGDGRTDLLWRVDGPWSPWHAIWWAGPDGSLSINATPGWIAMDDPSWRLAGAGDFNGDGVDDILWRHADGTVSNWLGSTSGAFTVNDAHARTGAPLDWQVAGIGDFNGDGRDDIVWRRDDGAISNWLGTADGGFQVNDANALNTPNSDFYDGGEVLAVGDFNGDGRDDLMMRIGTDSLYLAETGLDGSWYFWAGLGFVSRIPTGWEITGSGDYNGDGIDDLLWRNSDDGRLSNWLGTPAGYAFVVNDAHAMVHVPLAWQVADDPLI